jgi:hypothetical protein
MSETEPKWLTEYREAYREANGEECPPFQRRGSWWAMPRPGYTQKYRRAQLEAATQRLRYRARQKADLPTPSPQ